MPRRYTAHRKPARPSVPRPTGPCAAYPSDLTAAPGDRIVPFMPPETGAGRPRTTDRREVVTALLYLRREGCHWLALPHAFPPPGTVRDDFDRWCRDGTLQRLHDALRDQTRIAAERAPQPPAAVIDSPSVKTTEVAGLKGFDAGQKINGRKRHIVVDRRGRLLAVVVPSAGLQDGRGAELVLHDLERRYPTLEVVWADGGYPRNGLLKWVKERGVGWRREVVPRPPGTNGFVVQSERGVVERTFAWLGRSRRLSKDSERLTGTSEAMIQLAMIPIMVRRLEPAFQTPLISPVGEEVVAQVA